MVQPCAAASPAVGSRETVRTDVSPSDGPDGVSPPGEGLISGAVPLLMEQIEDKPVAKTKRVRIGSAARTVTTVTASEDINRQELVRPFLLERVSTQNAKPHPTGQPMVPTTDINLGAYL